LPEPNFVILQEGSVPSGGKFARFFPMLLTKYIFIAKVVFKFKCQLLSRKVSVGVAVTLGFVFQSFFLGVVAIEFLVRCDALSEEAFSLVGSLKDAVVLVSLFA
jgi:hypothetical protein